MNATAFSEMGILERMGEEFWEMIDCGLVAAAFLPLFVVKASAMSRL